MNNKTEQEIMQYWKGDINQPIVTICCTTYNHEFYIAEAIEGFLIQKTDFPFEILIRDDYSIDKTASIIKQYANKFPKLIKPIYEKENTYSKGVKPLQELYKNAEGQYIALCEGDDYWVDSTKLQKQVDFLQENPSYIITYADSQPFDENGFYSKNFGGATRDLSPNELLKSIPIYTLTACFRNVINEVPSDLLSARYGDRILWSLLGKYGEGKYLSDIKPSAYRVHDKGIHSKTSKKNKAEMRLITFTALFSYYKRIGNHQLGNYFKKKAFIAMLRSYTGI